LFHHATVIRFQNFPERFERLLFVSLFHHEIMMLLHGGETTFIYIYL